MAALLDRALRLSEFIEHTSAKRWEWGKRDCALWVADWVLLTTGRDPGTPFRGRYDSRHGCEALIHEYGGLTEIMRAGAAAISLEEIDYSAAAIGDAGIVMAPVQRDKYMALEETAAIRSGMGWVRFTPRGIVSDASRALMAWRV